MANIRLVQNDTGPILEVTLSDDETGQPIDVSNALDIVTLYFRKRGETTLKASIVGTKPGGGTDGVVDFQWSAGDLDEAGDYEGEVEVAFASGITQTMYEILNFYIREEIGP